ncbi:heme exporter protein CcmD [Erythrobacter sp.]|jgi:heme exporter protein CcmD|nr:heme exporter protein CcmD [Erythrobacter sp.]
MRETLDHWPYVIAAYALTLIAIGMLAAWSYRTMRRAEKRREDMKRK